MDSTDAATLVRAVLTLLDDPPLLATLAEGAASTSVCTCEEEADDLAALYEEVLTEANGAARRHVTESGLPTLH